ncbi:hypothetical protein DVH26_20420 [Paenibacillus sp. H1-7]|uniref:C39 family peptidase n=1 Tax=Paenibacillus sp. H1-7 TaxID=2282849 RepID=UPI001EF94B49|nr:C39 family peptidase [Paenibacillus sp. H1-7]ULL16599.1 hypothetical protein DVH26_20420 [Paenibacillus sp. H1-7]
MKKVLPNTKVLCEGKHGQNYWFHGCMEYLMDCLGESKEYNYWFFSGVTGDSFAQLYSKNIYTTAWYYTYNLFSYDIAKKAFDACGYDFEYISGITNENRLTYIPRIKKYIDKNIPVIARGGKDTWEFCNICGYDDNDLYFLICDCAEPKSYSNEFCELIFVGNKKEQPALADAYRQAILNIPSLMTMPATSEYSFGKQAFLDWADSFQTGIFDYVPSEKINVWNVHGTYLCISGTNGCSRGFLNKALELNPDMIFINKLEPLYAKQFDVFEVLAYRDQNGNNDYQNGGMQNGFKIKPEVISNIELMKPISDKIMESVKYCDEILKIFSECFHRKIHPNG